MSNDLSTPAARLKFARERAKYETAADAAEAFGFPVVAYRSHENGIRGFKASMAKRYAKAFGVSSGWLMTGDGLMLGASIDKEISELPPDIQSETLRDVRSLIAAARIRGRIPRR